MSKTNFIAADTEWRTIGKDSFDLVPIIVNEEVTQFKAGTCQILKEGNESIGVIGGNEEEGYSLKLLRGVNLDKNLIIKINKELKRYNLMLPKVYTNSGDLGRG